MTHNYSGKSLLELRKDFGTGKDGFWDTSWWLDEKFADEHPPAGKYELQVEKKQFHNMTYAQQKEHLPEGFDFPHPAVLAEALLTYLKATGEHLMKDWYSRTSVLDSDGNRVRVGFSADGVYVHSYWDGKPSDFIAVASARKFTATLDSRNLDPLESFETRLKKVEAWMEKVKEN